MGWPDYYHLLEQYDGDLSRAGREELEAAARANPNDPDSKEWVERFVKNEMNRPGWRDAIMIFVFLPIFLIVCIVISQLFYEHYDKIDNIEMRLDSLVCDSIPQIKDGE